MRVHWTNTALDHLLAIYQRIVRDSPIYALELMGRLITRSEQAGEFLMAGRMVPEYEQPDIREVIEGSYRVIYRVKEGQIDVLALVHGAQLIPPDL